MKPTPPFDLPIFLREMDICGAEHPTYLKTRLGATRFAQLVEDRYLAIMPVQRVGNLVVLGPRGREQLGKSVSGKTVPESALGQFFRRRLQETLELHNWHFEAYARPEYKPDPIPIFTDDKRKLFTLCKGAEYSVQTVKRLVADFEMQLHHEQGVILLVTEEPHRFRYLQSNPRWQNIFKTTTLKLD